MHADLFAAHKLAYEQLGFRINNLLEEQESQEYGACTFEMNSKNITFRVAKITPKKTGLFVTLWKRINNGPIIPYDITDPTDLFIISARNAKQFGQFIFPKNVLCQKGFVSHPHAKGKLAMRVYQPWDNPTSAHAKKTQAWQILYFFEIQPNTDSPKINDLFI